MVKGNFPSFIPKTDEERVQNIRQSTIDSQRDVQYYVTEKLDGSSSTFYKHEGVFGCCSRNMDLKETEGNTIWKIARENKIEENLPEGFAIQGEIVGEGIQKNPLKITGNKLYVFSAFNIKEGKYLDYKELVDLVNKMGLNMVPVFAETFLPDTIEKIVEMAEGPSILNENCQREGLVFRPVEESKQDPGRGLSRMSFKAISNKYLLEVEE